MTPEQLSEWRAALVAKYGEASVAEIEKPGVPWPCRDTMDGRHWCRVHDAPWPAWSEITLKQAFYGTGCEVWVSRDAAERMGRA